MIRGLMIVSAVDWDALDTSSKVLGLSFLVITIFTNASFVTHRLLKLKCGVFKEAKHSLQMSMVLGCLVKTFTYIVFVVWTFDWDANDCKLNYVCWVYNEYFFPFVFGCGLIIMCLKEVIRTSLFTKKHIMFSVICAGLPWILGLVIALPLAIANIDWDTTYGECEDKQSLLQTRAAHIICGCIPAAGAMVASLVVVAYFRMIKNTSRVRHEEHGNTPENIEFTSKASTGKDIHLANNNAFTRNEESAPPRDLPPPHSSLGLHNTQPHGQMAGPLQPPSYQDASVGLAVLMTSPASKDDNSREAYHDWPTPTNDSNGPQEQNESLQRMSHHWVLAISCIIFFLSATPLHACHLYIMDAYEMRRYGNYIIDDDMVYAQYVCGWLLSVFPVVVPMLWLFTSAPLSQH